MNHIITRTLFFLLICCCAALPVSAEVNEGDTPGLSVTTLGGEEMQLSDLRGRVVLLDFWATWCAPCQKSFPFYAELTEELGERGFTVVALSVDEKPEAVRAHISANPVPFVIGLDPTYRAATQFGPDGMPTAYLIDKTGRVRVVHNGFRPRDRKILRKEIMKLLEE